MSEGIDRYNVKIDYVGGEPIVSMQKQNHGPYVSYDEYAAACLSLGKLVSSSEAERYRVCGELLNRTETAESRLSEAVKVLEEAYQTISTGEPPFSARECKVSYALHQFLATLGEEND